jgi:hypothetical protein
MVHIRLRVYAERADVEVVPLESFWNGHVVLPVTDHEIEK